MTDPSFNSPLRKEERAALNQELISRLHQRGIRIENTLPTDNLDDLLTALDEFDAAVERAGGDLFVNSPDSSQPQRKEFVVPLPNNRETVEEYIERIQAATAKLQQ